MWAGTVVTPLGLTSALTVSTTSRSRSFAADQHIGEDRNSVAPLDYAVNVAERFEEFGALDGDLHAEPCFFLWEGPGVHGGIWRTPRRSRPARKGLRRALKLA